MAGRLRRRPLSTLIPPRALLMENATRRLEYLFSKYGQGEYTIGEPMTLTMHSAQTAELARQFTT